jgi:hypothetical protein
MPDDVQILYNSCVVKFMLNKEQERAFGIVSHHAIRNDNPQLRMYMGGMGGTGKTQVIKALRHFFELQNGNHCMMVVAPTGSAAALVSGYTFHSVLNIHGTSIIGCSIKGHTCFNTRETCRCQLYVS